MARDLAPARDLLRFIDASPSPHHAVAEAARRLTERGSVEIDHRDPLPRGGRHHLRHGGTLVAWVAPPDVGPHTAFHLVGAHTDSPGLRIKPRPGADTMGLRRLGVEVYGGALLNSWLDRDLGIAGRVTVRTAGGTDGRLVRLDDEPLRIPQLAIHLDREVNERGLVLNRQQHLVPLWGHIGDEPTEDVLRTRLAVAADVAPRDVLAWDLVLHPIEEGRLVGIDEAFVSTARIDNLLSCHAATAAVAAAPVRAERIAVTVLFDHEEVGSASDRGADGAFLAGILERIWLAADGDRAGFIRALHAGRCISADGAHATHPNYPDRHEPSHRIGLNGGVVLKQNANQRYATDDATAAVVLEACERLGLPVQWFVTRSDLACGSTIGPLTAAALGIPTVDVGAPQLAMHSARELCGSGDVADLGRLLADLLA